MGHPRNHALHAPSMDFGHQQRVMVCAGTILTSLRNTLHCAEGHGATAPGPGQSRSPKTRCISIRFSVCPRHTPVTPNGGKCFRQQPVVIWRRNGMGVPVECAFAVDCTPGASGVRENAAGRRNERKGRSTPRTIRDPCRAKGWSPAAFERVTRSDSRTGAACDPMERPNGKRDRRANGQRHEKKLAPVAESGTADAADREPVDHCDHHSEFFRRQEERAVTLDAARVTETGTVGTAVADASGKMIVAGTGRRRSSCRKRRAAKPAAVTRHGSATGTVVEHGPVRWTGRRSRRERYAKRKASETGSDPVRVPDGDAEHRVGSGPG